MGSGVIIQAGMEGLLMLGMLFWVYVCVCTRERVMCGIRIILGWNGVAKM